MNGSLDGYEDFELLKVAETATCLRISRDLAYELIASGDLPSIRLGRKILVPAFALKEWIRQQAGGSVTAPEVVYSPHPKKH